MNVARIVSLALLVFASTLASCAPNDTGPGPCPQFETVTPSVALLYPAPGATGVALAGTSIVYGDGGSPVPITLVAGTASPIATVPTAVPAPLPSAAATPPPALTPYAVSAGNLQPATTYHVETRVRYTSGCGGTTTGDEQIGSFATTP